MSDAFSRSVDDYINALDSERNNKTPLFTLSFGGGRKTRHRSARGGSGVNFRQGQLNVFDNSALQALFATQPSKTRAINQQAIQQSMTRTQQRRRG